MAVTKTEYGNYTLLTGTMIEVVAQVNVDNVPKEILNIGGESATAWAVY